MTQYDYVAVLGQHKIYPDDVQTYTREAIFAAVKDMFGVDPSIDCIYNKVSLCDRLFVFLFSSFSSLFSLLSY